MGLLHQKSVTQIGFKNRSCISKISLKNISSLLKVSINKASCMSKKNFKNRSCSSQIGFRKSFFFVKNRFSKLGLINRSGLQKNRSQKSGFLIENWSSKIGLPYHKSSPSPEAPAWLAWEDGATLGAPTSTLTAGRGDAGWGASRCNACAAPGPLRGPLRGPPKNLFKRVWGSPKHVGCAKLRACRCPV